MPRRYRRLLMGLLLALLAELVGGHAMAAETRPDSEQKRIDEQWHAEQAACRGRFDVNACLAEARLRHRKAVAELKATRQADDARQRSQRAAARQAAIDRRQEEVQARTAAASSAAASSGKGARTAAAPSARAASRPASPAASDGAQARAAERAAAAQRVQATIRADQARIQARVAQRAAKGASAAPLPPPGSAASR